MLNVYPYYDYMRSNGVIPLDYALFRPLPPNKEVVDASANVPVMVTETGWPHKGDASAEPDANTDNVDTYNSDLIRRRQEDDEAFAARLIRIYGRADEVIDDGHVHLLEDKRRVLGAAPDVAGGHELHAGAHAGVMHGRARCPRRSGGRPRRARRRAPRGGGPGGTWRAGSPRRPPAHSMPSSPSSLHSVEHLVCGVERWWAAACGADDWPPGGLGWRARRCA
ncbi:hypothetical protein QYE76_015676 [Lolium multiflorum]|uniref:Glucan endo-1,3-beta-D-glucosidase n=1 Tax=Lolium multiflorum TaxID=4521 RepID=A0AAD8U704_LOLMU|nr:hypothetical protein QYE76_015676 [Lolium multiflorum]